MLAELKEAVMEGFGFPVKEQPTEPVCNLHIDIKGWQRTYTNLDYSTFLINSSKLRKVGKFAGDFTLFRNGTLSYRTTKGLHKYNCKLDLDELVCWGPMDNFELRPFRMFNLPHLHAEENSCYFHSGEIIANLHPDSLRENSAVPRLIASPLSGPHYTLSGLYDSLSDLETNTKIAVLTEELLIRKGYRAESIATRKETRLKLLENAYRKFISDQ